MYYLVLAILYPISLLPLRVLYIFADGVYGLIFYILKYRRSVVMANLEKAFPEKSPEERYKIAKQFYHNLIDTFIESLKLISMSGKELARRSKGDYTILNDLISKEYNIHIMAGHQFNWEFANLIYAKNLPVPFVGVYMPISNKALDKIFYNMRERYGTILVSATDFKTKMHNVFNSQYMLALAADQNPGHPRNAYWMNFMGHPAPFVTGPSRGAIKNKAAVVYVRFTKTSRGHYTFTSTLLTEDATQFTPQQLTLLYKKELEKTIHADPANYLWSHRRWKYEWKPEHGELIG